jgi:hypothetical protein
MGFIARTIHPELASRYIPQKKHDSEEGLIPRSSKAMLYFEPQ